MDEYKVRLAGGVVTTMQLDDEAAKQYPGAERVVREKAAVASGGRRARRSGGKETR